MKLERPIGVLPTGPTFNFLAREEEKKKGGISGCHSLGCKYGCWAETERESQRGSSGWWQQLHSVCSRPLALSLPVHSLSRDDSRRKLPRRRRHVSQPSAGTHTVFLSETQHQQHSKATFFFPDAFFLSLNRTPRLYFFFPSSCRCFPQWYGFVGF